jgi:hypothetical protein
MKRAICERMTLGALFIFLLAGSAGRAQSRIAIPSYQDPGSSQWNAWIAPGSSSIGIMIVNENNGDDLNYYPEIAASIRQARKKGIFVVGYVYTGYGQRDPAIVRKDIDGVFQNYLVDGIFFDEVPTDCNAATPKSGTTYRYYQDLANYVRSRQAGGRIVILNPGTQPPNDCWMSLANILVSAESNGVKDYTQNYQDQAWFHRYSPSRFWHIVYNVAEKTNFDKVVSMSRERGAGWIYVTDGGSNNPYAQPPAYWSLETSQVAGQDVQDPYATYRPPSQDENGNPVAARFSIRWTTAKDAAWNIFIETDRTNDARYHSSNGGLTIAADFLLQIKEDGQTVLLRYTGNGTDWAWEEVGANAVRFKLSGGAILAEANAAALGDAHSVRYQIQETGAGGFISVAEPLSLNNFGYLFDIEAH